MRKLSFILGSLATVLLIANAFAAESPLSNQDVMKLVKLGIGDDAVIAKIRQAPAVDFKLETDDLGSLKAAGVSGKVIAAMLDRSSGAVVGGVVTPSSVRGLVGGPASGALQPGHTVLDARDGTKPLTMHLGEFHQNGFAGIGNTFYVYAGARCAVRTTDRRPTVTIRRDTAPQEQVFLAKLDSDPKANDRSLKIGSLMKGGNPFSDKSEANPDPDWTVAYDATESPTGTWHVTPKADLPPGEYGLYAKHSVLFDFGIDDASPSLTGAH